MGEAIITNEKAGMQTDVWFCSAFLLIIYKVYVCCFNLLLNRQTADSFSLWRSPFRVRY